MKPFARHVMGKSIEGRPLISHELRIDIDSNVPAGNRCIAVFGGFHGDEPKSVYVVEKLLDQLGGRNEARWLLMPVVNPDGYERRKRRNARNVDINRNFPTKNWGVGNPRSRMFGGYKPASEPETEAVIRVIEEFRPDVIVTIHSIDRNRYCINFDGPGRELARRISRYNKYPVTSTIGYPTPGSFGTWAGVERGIPTITLELPSHHSAKRCWEDNREALLGLRIPSAHAPGSVNIAG